MTEQVKRSPRACFFRGLYYLSVAFDEDVAKLADSTIVPSLCSGL